MHGLGHEVEATDVERTKGWQWGCRPNPPRTKGCQGSAAVPRSPPPSGCPCCWFRQCPRRKFAVTEQLACAMYTQCATPDSTLDWHTQRHTAHGTGDRFRMSMGIRTGAEPDTPPITVRKGHARHCWYLQRVAPTPIRPHSCCSRSCLHLSRSWSDRNHTSAPRWMRRRLLRCPWAEERSWDATGGAGKVLKVQVHCDTILGRWCACATVCPF